jgi:type I restriction enzyme M protein
MVNRYANGGELGFETKLWAAADKLRGHLDAAEYKDVVLGLIFLKYISDAFVEHYEQLQLWTADPESEYYIKDPKKRYIVLEDRDEYLAENIFWVPEQARWAHLQAHAKDPSIGILIDEAMEAIERENPRLKGVLPQGYGRDDLDKRRLGELVDLIGTIGLGDSASRSKDILGRVYEYFLGQFADAEGKKGGEFYTPKSIVQLLVAMLEPYQGRVYDPCCGSGGMFVQSERFVEAHGGRIEDISIYGQESNPTTWRLCKMNLAIRGIEGNLGGEPADSFHNDLHPDLKADTVIANPPFNMSDWGGHLLQDDVRWQYGTPPANNANFAWVQHFVHHLAYGGQAGFVLANGSMSTQTSGEGEIRRALVEHDLVACMVALPPQLFYNTQIPACLWFLDRAKPAHRAGETLFIDARDAGEMVSRTRRVLIDEEITRIAGVYYEWRNPEGNYEDEPGFCASADLAEIKRHGFVLTPGRYVGFEEEDDDGEPFEVKMERLTADLAAQFAESARLEGMIRENLRRIGQDYGFGHE